MVVIFSEAILFYAIWNVVNSTPLNSMFLNNASLENCLESKGLRPLDFSSGHSRCLINKSTVEYSIFEVEIVENFPIWSRLWRVESIGLYLLIYNSHNQRHIHIFRCFRDPLPVPRIEHRFPENFSFPSKISTFGKTAVFFSNFIWPIGSKQCPIQHKKCKTTIVDAEIGNKQERGFRISWKKNVFLFSMPAL